MAEQPKDSNYQRIIRNLKERNENLCRELDLAHKDPDDNIANEAAEANPVLYEEIQEYRKIILGVLYSLTYAIDAKDTYTSGHSSRVATLSVTIGKEMGLDNAWLERLEYSSLLHDIGKIGIPESILLKKGKLTDEEKSVMNTHPEISAQIIQPISFFSNLVPIVRHHHEHFDGQGYPEGLVGEEIPFGARILALADASDAMRSDRCYRHALPKEIMIEEIKNNSGTQFDPSIVKILLTCLKNDLDLLERDY